MASWKIWFAFRLLALDYAEDAKRDPFLLSLDLGLLAALGDGGSLLGVLLGRGDHLTAVVNAVVLVDDV